MPPSSTRQRRTLSDDALTDRVRAALGHLPRLEEKRMFGGIAFMLDGKMCVTVGKGRLMCRIDPAMHDAAVAQTGCRTVVMKGRSYRGWVFVDPAILRTKKQLGYWIGLALDFNARAKASARH